MKTIIYKSFLLYKEKIARFRIASKMFFCAHLTRSNESITDGYDSWYEVWCPRCGWHSEKFDITKRKEKPNDNY